MFTVPTIEMSREFHAVWLAAGQHLERQVDQGISWLKCDPRPPFLEHLSFRLGNQLFFIRVMAEDGSVEAPGHIGGLEAIAKGCNGHACLMPMRMIRGEWRPLVPGWGLVDLVTELPVDPPALVTDEAIEMTDWELQDFAVQVVRDMLRKEGHELMSWNGNPDVNPSLWFLGEDGPEWVLVRAVRYPIRRAPFPVNWKEIARSLAALSRKGHFASVAVACGGGPAGEGFLARGHGLMIAYEGLEPGPG